LISPVTVSSSGTECSDAGGDLGQFGRDLHHVAQHLSAAGICHAGHHQLSDTNETGAGAIPPLFPENKNGPRSHARLHEHHAGSPSLFDKGEVEQAAMIFDRCCSQMESPDPNILIGYGTILVAQQKFGLGISLLQTGIQL
jgi:hypothetical protein